MANTKFGLGHIQYVGLSKLDKSEQQEIKEIVNSYLKKFKRIADFQRLRLHFKAVHEKKLAKQIPVHQFDGTLVTNKGSFFARASHRNPYHATADLMENLLKQAKHKHPHKEEWKEGFKKPRQVKRGRKT